MLLVRVANRCHSWTSSGERIGTQCQQCHLTVLLLHLDTGGKSSKRGWSHSELFWRARALETACPEAPAVRSCNDRSLPDVLVMP